MALLVRGRGTWCSIPNMTYFTPKNNNNKNRKQKIQSSQIVGNGDYKSVLKNVLSTITPALKTATTMAMTSAGRAAGGMVGFPDMGAKLGKAASNRMNKIYGSGDYYTNDVQYNSLFPGAKPPPVTASFSSTHPNRIRHREFVMDLVTGSTYTPFFNQSLSINPGLIKSFPYLAPIANQYAEWVPMGLIVEYVPMTSPYNTTSSMGAIIVSTNPNSSEPLFSSKSQMENSGEAVSARPDKPILFGVECYNPAQNCYYVRSGESTLPLTTTDLCNVQIAQALPDSYPTGAKLGEIWVSYDFELRIPRLSNDRFGYLHYRATQSMDDDYYFTLGDSNQTTVRLGTFYGALVDSSAGTVSFPNALIGDTYYVTLLVTFPEAWQVTDALSFSSAVGFTSADIFSASTANTVEVPGVLGDAGSVCALGAFTVSDLSQIPTLYINKGQIGNIAPGEAKFDLIICDLGSGMPSTL